MNLILFEASELARPLPAADRRAVHLREVLRRRVGDSFDAGVVNGPRGKGIVTEISPELLAFTFTGGPPPPPPAPIHLLVGLTRPQTARDILRDATSLGLAALHFIRTEKAEASYAQSTLWSSGEWRRHLITGAEQAFDTRIPDVTHGLGLADALETLRFGARRVALDNYESPSRLGEIPLVATDTVVLAIGAERGWSAREREALRGAGFDFAHLGPRVLRTETAVVAALAIVRSRLGLI